MEEDNNKNKGDNPKGQGPSKSKKVKTKEEKEAQRAKQAEKKRLKKEEAARKEAEAKLKAEGIPVIEQVNEKPKEKEELKAKDESEKENKTHAKNKEKKENIQKRKNKIFGLTTYEERMQELNEESKNQNDQTTHQQENLSLFEIIEFLSKNADYSKVNDELIISLRNIFLCGSSKQTSNCINLLNSLSKLIDTLSNDDEKKDDQICQELSSLIKKIQELLSYNSEKCSGIYNTCRYLQLLSDNILSELSEKLKTYKLASITLKDLIKSKINYFIERRVKKLVFENININLINDEETILLFGKSKIFKKILLKAKKDNKRFKIIFVDSPKRSQFSTEIEFFNNLGIPVTLTYISGVYHLMQNVSKIFIKADALLANGDLIGKNGISILASIAKIYNVPVYAFCPFFKFMNKIKLSNEPKTVEQGEFKKLIFDYDITPANLINDIVCDNGFICSSSIPIYIKEIEEQNLNYINEKKYKLEMQ